MTPYYQEKNITIYHGNSLEILPQLEDQFDLIITDPPYNCGKNYSEYKDNLFEFEYYDFMGEIISLCMAKANNQFWVAPRYKLSFFLSLLGGHLIVIERKAQGLFREGWSDQFEIAIAKGKPNQGAPPDLWKDIRLKGEGYFFREETFGNPGYTPYNIMARAINLLSINSICDPFCGTGTSLLAAKNLGRTAIGIDISEQECEKSIKRLAQEVLPFGKESHVE